MTWNEGGCSLLSLSSFNYRVSEYVRFFFFFGLSARSYNFYLVYHVILRQNYLHPAPVTCLKSSRVLGRILLVFIYFVHMSYSFYYFSDFCMFQISWGTDIVSNIRKKGFLWWNGKCENLLYWSHWKKCTIPASFVNLEINLTRNGTN